jgi:hypothetical protein
VQVEDLELEEFGPWSRRGARRDPTSRPTPRLLAQDLGVGFLVLDFEICGFGRTGFIEERRCNGMHNVRHSLAPTRRLPHPPQNLIRHSGFKGFRVTGQDNRIRGFGS